MGRLDMNGSAAGIFVKDYLMDSMRNIVFSLAIQASQVYTERVEKEAKCMKTVTIKLGLAENVKSFVNIINRYPYDVDLRAGRHVVDAKSILGIFSLDLSKPITMEIYAEKCDDLLADIKPFVA
jgi:phosphocarrier protein HPr